MEKKNNVQQNLREKMIRENQAEHGVYIEIEIAVRNKVPVFLVESVGGLIAEMASEYGTEQNWNEINNAP